MASWVMALGALLQHKPFFEVSRRDAGTVDEDVLMLEFTQGQFERIEDDEAYLSVFKYEKHKAAKPRAKPKAKAASSIEKPRSKKASKGSTCKEIEEAAHKLEAIMVKKKKGVQDSSDTEDTLSNPVKSLKTICKPKVEGQTSKIAALAVKKPTKKHIKVRSKPVSAPASQRFSERGLGQTAKKVACVKTQIMRPFLVQILWHKEGISSVDVYA
ncbi:hypothetical protein DFH06DRAFT_1143128 [Mycena polygramma]|nr:hypothetical protein DFH06DRAFT_1143128 [Mycena polygramma]